MAEEDLIFGKNRHFFGGIEPSNMLTFSLGQLFDDDNIPYIVINAILPNDTVVDDQTLCTVAGAVIRRRTDRYPDNEFDGDLIADISTSGILNDTDVTYGLTYYYAAFPYTKQGVYNRNPANRAEYQMEDYYYFGFDLDMTNSDPDARVTYPDEVQNTSFTPAYMDFETGVFNYGSWPNAGGKYFMPRPVALMCDAEGNVTIPDDGYLNEDDYTKDVYSTGNIDKYLSGGIDTSTVEVCPTFFNIMMQWPKIYTYREKVDGIYKFRCSDKKLGEDWDCYCNYNGDGEEIDNFYTPVYMGTTTKYWDDESSYTTILQSISGTTPDSDNTASGYITYATNNNKGIQSGWNIETFYDRCLIQDLLVLMAKSTDTQSKYGTGFTDENNTAMIANGTMDDKGLFWGTNDGLSGVKVFGMENWWGNLARATSGLVLSRKYSGSSAGVSQYENLLYRGLGFATYPITSKSSNNASSVDENDYLTYSNSSGSEGRGDYLGYQPAKPRVFGYGRIPIVPTHWATTSNGSASTYECDYSNYNASFTSDTPKFLRCGASGTSFGFQNGTKAGAFAIDFGYTASEVYGGAALSFKPADSVG